MWSGRLLTKLAVLKAGRPNFVREGVVPASRRHLATAAAAIVVVLFLQQSGQIVSDTKLDIAIAPLTFLGHALSLWAPQQEFGGVPFQAYGYLVPMGPFFIVGHLLHLPTWVIQRLWVSTLLITAYWGFVRLAEAIGIGSRLTRTVAGLAFAFGPPISLLGAKSAFVLPFSLLPWVMLPLVRSEEGGSPRVAACRSGVAVFLMGGVNAAASVAVLPIPFIWFLTRMPGRWRRQLFSWWVLAVFLACAWWASSLYLETRYGFNLLPYTESAATTTATTPLFDVLRGNSYWVAYDQIGVTAIRSGLQITSYPIMIISGAVISALGLFGLAHRGLKERTWLIASLAVGVILVGAGYPGLLGAPFHAGVQSILSGALALFRNVWKFQPVINLVLMLGLAHALLVLGGPVRRKMVQAKSGLLALRSHWRLLVHVAAAAALVGVSVPFLTQSFFNAGSFSSVPAYWQATANWLGTHSGTTTSLVVPGSGVGIYKWGYPIDEPMQYLAQSDWAIRGLIPDSSVGNIEMQDAVEEVLDSGVQNPGLAPYLAQAGVKYLVVRNDLAPGAGAPSPLQLRLELKNAPGFSLVAGFGPKTTYRYKGIRARVPTLQIYKVDSGVSTVSTSPVANSIVVSGSPTGLLSMDELGLNPGNRAVILAGDGGVTTGNQTWVDTDSSPRVGVTFGEVRYNETYVLTRNGTNLSTGKQPVGWIIVPGVKHQSVATFIGAKNITASSFGASVLFDSPEDQPSAAFDNDPDTGWVANATNNSVGQWIRIDFTRKRAVSHVGIRLLASPKTPRVTEVKVTTSRGSLTETVHPSKALQQLRVPRGSTQWLKITFARVLAPHKPNPLSIGAGIQEISIPHLVVRHAEKVPSDELARFSKADARLPVYVFTSSTPRFIYGLKFGGDDQEPQLRRIFSTPRSGAYAIKGMVTLRPGESLAQFLRFISAKGLGPQPVHEACGSGPTLTLDGEKLSTEVNGTVGGFAGFKQLQFSVCGGPVALAQGTHVLAGNTGGFLKILSVALTPARVTPYADTGPSRSVKIQSWGTESRTVSVGPGGASYLTVKQNFNKGWTARLDGESLQPVRINGWQQAWVVPKGQGGLVTLNYGPDRVYQAGLIIGAILALLLIALAIVPARRTIALAGRGPRPSFPIAFLAGGAAVAMFVVVGSLALALPVVIGVIWLARTRSRKLLSTIAGIAYVAAGIAVAVHRGTYTGSGLGAFGRPAQIASALALAAVFASLVTSSDWWVRRREPDVKNEVPIDTPSIEDNRQTNDADRPQ